MLKQVFKRSDPFLQLIILLLLAFFFVSVFLLMAQGLVNFLWGLDITSPDALQDFTNPQIVNINRVLISFQHIGFFIVPGLIFARLVSDSAPEYLYLKPKPHLRYVILGVVTMLVALPLINYLSIINERMDLPESLNWLEELMRSMEANAARLTEAILSTESNSVLILNIIIVAVLPAVGEEIIFRGALMRILSKWTGNAHAGIWIAAFLFSAIHLQFYGFLPRLLMGAFLGYLFIWSGSLWVPIIAHFANNATAILLYFYINKKSLDENISEIGGNEGDILYALTSAVILSILLFVFYKQSRFKDIKSNYLFREDRVKLP